MDIIEAIHISKSFGSLQVLKGISVTIRKGEIVTIVGASGAGKTTFLQIMGTLLKTTDGIVRINGNNISELREKELSRFRNRHIGFVFQFHHLLPEFTALENVSIPAFIAGVPKQTALKRATEILEFLALGHRLDHKPSELSGGEQQRVAVARALINNPDVVLADEPSGNLDSHNKKELHELFFTLRTRLNQTFVIVTHDNELAGMSDRTITMHDGLLVN
jgi:lipoprotein-releasing system ATP-binding protein